MKFANLKASSTTPVFLKHGSVAWKAFQGGTGRGGYHRVPRVPRTNRTGILCGLPSGKHTKSYWKLSFIVNSPKKMWFSIVMLVYQRVTSGYCNMASGKWRSWHELTVSKGNRKQKGQKMSEVPKPGSHFKVLEYRQFIVWWRTTKTCQ